MACTTTNIYQVSSIKVVVKDFKTSAHPFVTTEFIFTATDGHEITVSAFSPDFLEIQGAEHVNTVATAQEPSCEAAADAHFLDWMADRLVEVYKEPENIDFVSETRRIAQSLCGRPANEFPA
jgi:hypothetical protein